MKQKTGVVILIVLLAGVLFGASYFSKNAGKVSRNEIESKELENTITENGAVQEVSASSFSKEVLQSDKKVLIDFYADWCEPCKMLSPLVEQVASENSDVKFVKINVDENDDLATRYRVLYIPTLVVIENGEEINRAVGYIEKNEIQELIR
ncbi:MAG: thioredoxin [Clostridia bacterium]|nr:thioredoxin [Clostridia bacterium]